MSKVCRNAIREVKMLTRRVRKNEHDGGKWGRGNRETNEER